MTYCRIPLGCVTLCPTLGRDVSQNVGDRGEVSEGNRCFRGSLRISGTVRMDEAIRCESAVDV